MERFVVAVMDIGEAFTPCAWMLRVLHAQNVNDHPIDDVSLAISLGVESCGFSELGIKHRPDT